MPVEAKIIYSFKWNAEGKEGLAMFAGPGAEKAAKLCEAAPQLFEALHKIETMGPMERFGANIPARLLEWVQEVRMEAADALDRLT